MDIKKQQVKVWEIAILKIIWCHYLKTIKIQIKYLKLMTYNNGLKFVLLWKLFYRYLYFSYKRGNILDLQNLFNSKI